MTDSNGVGNLRLPYLETIDVRTEKRWLAVSVDPEMQFDQHAAEPLAAVAVPVFLRHGARRQRNPVSRTA